MTRPESLILAALLAAAPLAFGAVEPWAVAVLEAGVFAALALVLHRRRHGGGVRVAAVPGALPLGLLLGLAALQAVPLPPALVGLLSPRALAVHRETLGAAGPLPWVTLSVAPAATAREVLRLGALAAAYALAAQLFTRRGRVRGFAVLLAAAAAAVAFLAIVQSIAAPTRLLFVRPAPFDSTPFGPYVNRNHFGNLMAMLAPLALGLFLAHPAGAPGGARGLRARLARAIARPESAARLLLGFAALLAAAALLLSRSRGAAAALLAALGVLAALLPRGGGARGRAVPALALAGALAVFTGWFGWGRVTERIAATAASGTAIDAVRAIAWGDTLRMAADFPLLGAGVGSFEDLYPRYRTIPGDALLRHAHSDWLELAAGAGAAGIALGCWFLAAALAAVLRARRDGGGDRLIRCVGAGAAAGATAFLLHGLVDFSLALAANGLVFAVLLALATASPAPPPRDADAGTDEPADGGGRPRPARATLPRWVAPAAVAVAAAVAARGAAETAARLAWRRAEEESRLLAGLPLPPPGTRARYELAARLDPLEAGYRLDLARLAVAGGETAEARVRAREALRRRPLAPDALGALARAAAAAGDPGQARRLLAAAVAAAPRDPDRRIALGAWLLSHGERAAGVAALGEATALAPDRVPTALAVAALHRVPDAEVAPAVPPDPPSQRALARYAEGVGNDALAEASWRRAAAAADPVQAGEGERGLRRFLAARARRAPAD